jgi:hypothetical protein
MYQPRQEYAWQSQAAAAPPTPAPAPAPPPPDLVEPTEPKAKKKKPKTSGLIYFTECTKPTTTRIRYRVLATCRYRNWAECEHSARVRDQLVEGV